MAINVESVEAVGGFIVRALLSLAAVIFCCIQLTKMPDSPVYIGLLSSIVSLWMPASTISVTDVIKKVRELAQLQQTIVQA